MSEAPGRPEREDARDRVPLADSLTTLRAVDQATDAGFTEGMREGLVRFMGLFDELWEEDPEFREEWRPRRTRLAQILSGRYLDRRLNELSDAAGIRIERQLSEHGGSLDFIGTTRYKPAKGGRSLKLRGAYEPRSSERCTGCVGTRDPGYRGEGTYSVAELIISPDGELLMLERDVTGGVRHLWAYYVDGLKNRRLPDADKVTSPDIMDARLLLDDETGTWRHRTRSLPVHRSRLCTGYTEEWSRDAPWLDGDPGSGIVVVPPPGARSQSSVG